MAMWLKLWLAAAWCGLAAGLVIRWGTCPKPPVKQNFDVTRYMGKWWEYQRFPAPFEFAVVCGSANYTLLQSDLVKVVNAGIQDIKIFGWTVRRAPTVAEGEAKIVDPAMPSELLVSFGDMPQIGPSTEPNYLVVDTDYDNFAVVYSCSSFGPLNFQLAWILTRAQGVKPSQYDAIYTTLRNAGVDTGAFITVDHSNCKLTRGVSVPVGFGPCPTPPVVDNFQLDQYAGTWYEYERFPAPFEFLVKCGQAHYYIANATTVLVNNTGIRERRSHVVQTEDVEEGNYWVLATDYNSFSLVYSCAMLPL
ncbi:hypothetical protein BaRGS_00008590, partial [Batillaria attramentaria]